MVAGAGPAADCSSAVTPNAPDLRFGRLVLISQPAETVQCGQEAQKISVPSTEMPALRLLDAGFTGGR